MLDFFHELSNCVNKFSRCRKGDQVDSARRAIVSTRYVSHDHTEQVERNMKIFDLEVTMSDYE
jgi:hypothetical protein